MSEFTIGQRVRIVCPNNMNGSQGTIYDIWRPPHWVERLFGAGSSWIWSPEAIRLGVHPRETAYLIRVDGDTSLSTFFGPLGFPAYWLRPLEDPKADAFIETVKSWKPEPAPVALPEKAVIAQSTPR